MLLTLPQRMYLLAYSVDKEKFEATNLQGRGSLLRAAALAELTLNGWLDAQEKKVVRRPGTAPDDGFLADVWRDIPEKPQGWLKVVHDKHTTAEEPVREQLLRAGSISSRAKRGFLSSLVSPQVQVTDPQEVMALQKTARQAVLAEADPALVPDQELVMTVLPVECEMSTVFSSREMRDHKHTLKQLAERFDELVPGLRKALRDSYLVVRGVGGG
ncbi:GPP34 family phosphoprotein [Streptomyces parvulus]|uniref:GPP34 family phosphoprotein n=1 Tax=Streptomyces parvulus TaxID=146923 RepID=A0A369UUA8_9ACTN|nr:GPP34 family phosphoprotein [Streptomyces parvulus]RDD84344.1 GPP34 family phosphoprotein [Streptomyces parvulus]